MLDCCLALQVLIQYRTNFRNIKNLRVSSFELAFSIACQTLSPLSHCRGANWLHVAISIYVVLIARYRKRFCIHYTLSAICLAAYTEFIYPVFYSSHHYKQIKNSSKCLSLLRKDKHEYSLINHQFKYHFIPRCSCHFLTLTNKYSLSIS